MERSHQEAMRERGILLNDVFRAFGHEWSSMLPVCEYLLYNIPRGDTGLTPTSRSTPRGRSPSRSVAAASPSTWAAS